MNALMMGIGAFSSWLVSDLFGRVGVLAVTGSMAVFCALALLVYVLMVKLRKPVVAQA